MAMRYIDRTVQKGACSGPIAAPGGRTIWGIWGRERRQWWGFSLDTFHQPPGRRLQCFKNCVIWTVHIYGTYKSLWHGSRGENSQLEPGGEERIHQQKRRKTFPGAVCPARRSIEGLYWQTEVWPWESSPQWGLAALNPKLLLLPLFREGSFKGMLMIPTKSSVGTRERRIDLIRMASPFPVWISCNAGLENKIKEVPTLVPPPSKSLAVKWFYLRTGYTSKFL